MNLGDFLKEKVINFTQFLKEQGVDLPEVEKIPPLLLFTTLKASLPTEQIKTRDIEALHASMQAESTLDLKSVIAQVREKYLDMPLQQRDKFWRYLDCFSDCINSEHSP